MVLLLLDGVASSRKYARRQDFRYQMELNFPLKEGKDLTLARLGQVKWSLATKMG